MSYKYKIKAYQQYPITKFVKKHIFRKDILDEVERELNDYILEIVDKTIIPVHIRKFKEMGIKYEHIKNFIYIKVPYELVHHLAEDFFSVAMLKYLTVDEMYSSVQERREYLENPKFSGCPLISEIDSDEFSIVIKDKRIKGFIK